MKKGAFFLLATVQNRDSANHPWPAFSKLALDEELEKEGAPILSMSAQNRGPRVAVVGERGQGKGSDHGSNATNSHCFTEI